MNTRSQHGARPRRTSGLTTVVFFGLLIGIVLVGSQLVAMWWWPVRHFDGYAGVLGALFLAAGLIVGLRGRVTGRTSSPNRAPPAGSATIHVPATPSPALVEPLTPRELKILASLAEGWSNAEIAEKHTAGRRSRGPSRRARSRDRGRLDRLVAHERQDHVLPGRRVAGWQPDRSRYLRRAPPTPTGDGGSSCDRKPTAHSRC